MSPEPCSCGLDDAVERVEQIMAELKVRRVPVVDTSGHTIGMVSQADLARAANGPHLISEHDVAHVVSHVSQPGKGHLH
jgi:predicted transcriptional regulator